MTDIFAPDYDAPIPYMQRTRDYYQALGYGTPYRWAHYVEVPFTPLRKPLAASPGDPRSPRRRRTSPTRATRDRARPTTAAAKFYKVYSGDTRSDARPAHLARRLRPQAHHGRGQRHLVPAAGAARARRRPGASARVAPRFHGAPTNRSHRVTLETDAPGDPAPLPRRRRRRRDPGAELPGLPPDLQPGRAPSGGERHPHRGDGLRQGHRRARRRAALPVQRLPARQQRRQAARRGLAGRDAGAGAARAGERRPARAPRCSRRCAGATMRRGSSTT